MTFPGGRIALDRVSLDLQRGDFLTLLGPSGCGKSTLLRIIAGLMQADAGSVRWNDPEGIRQRIGFVFQEPTLMPWATVFDNVYLPLRLRGESRGMASDRVHEVLARVGLPDLAAAYPRQLSGGMKMRVSIARALVTDPKVLLMDEPFAALDEMTRLRLNHDLLEMRTGRDLTIVFVTHSVYESAFLSSRVAVMAAHPGRILAEFSVPMAYPRTDDFRLTRPFAEICARISETLEGALLPEDLL